MQIKIDVPIPVNPRDFYKSRAKALLKDLREDKHVSYEELAARLKPLGVHIETQALINKVNRGTYGFVFALQVLAALGVRSIEVPRFEPPKRPAPSQGERS